MAIELRRCPSMWVRIGAEPGLRVEKALDEQGVECEVIRGPFRRGRRVVLEKLEGQRQCPVIELEDGMVCREESRDVAARIRRGEFVQGDAPVAWRPTGLGTRSSQGASGCEALS